MGTWSTKLYGSDYALDLKAEVALSLRMPASAADVVERLIGRHDEASDPTHADHCEFWLVLADVLHAHGLDDERTFATARAIITNGLDAAAQRARGMSERDMGRRAQHLSERLRAWCSPIARPKPRRIVTSPEPILFSAGTVLVYPTDHGAAANPYDTSNAFGFSANGWGSAVVLATGHVEGLFAWVEVARLGAHGPERPSFTACLASGIETQPNWTRPDGGDTLAIGLGALPKKHASRMGLEAIGQVAFDVDCLRGLTPRPQRPDRPPEATVSGVFRWWTATVWTRFEGRDPTLSAPCVAVPLTELIQR